MVDIAPKALRFARLAAEQLPAYSNDPEVEVIRHQEEVFGRRPAGKKIRRYVRISRKTANFCITVMTNLLEREDVFQSSEWDGNDFFFIKAVTVSLREQLRRSSSSAV